jgi:hypothetical protein
MVLIQHPFLERMVMLFKMQYKEDNPEYMEANKLLTDLIKNTSCRSIAEDNNFLSTGQALFYLVFQTHRICDSILLRFIDDYPLVILYRSLIEHSMKHFYIFSRFHKENNDEVGKQYYFDCIYDEQFKKANAILWPNFFKVKPEKKNEHKQIKKNADQFTFRNMSNFIGTIDLPGISNDLVQFTKKLKSDYNLSSSYVHGGPEAISMETKIPKKNIQYSSVATSILTQIHTIKTFAKYESQDKERLIEDGNKLYSLLEKTLSKWEASLEQKD